jgi:hypothetical protein
MAKISFSVRDSVNDWLGAVCKRIHVSESDLLALMLETDLEKFEDYSNKAFMEDLEVVKAHERDEKAGTRIFDAKVGYWKLNFPDAVFVAPPMASTNIDAATKAALASRGHFENVQVFVEDK